MLEINIIMSHFRICLVSLLTSILLFTSCSTFLYTDSQRIDNAKCTIHVKNPNSFTIEFPKLKKTSVEPQVRYESNSATIIFKSLGKKYRTLIISKPNCISDTVFVKIKPRFLPLIEDISLSLFTFGTPLVFDVFRTDFYKISDKSIEINVPLNYTIEYTKSQFANISKFRNTGKYKQFISEFQDSTYKAMANDSIDRIDLDKIKSRLSETAINEYIDKRKNSKYVNEAISLKSYIQESINEFESSKKTNTVESYEKYLSKYPYSVNDKNAKLLLISEAEKNTKTINKSNVTIRFINDYLSLNEDSYKLKINEYVNLFKDQISTECKLYTYDSIANNWRLYNLTDKKNINKGNLSDISTMSNQCYMNYLYNHVKKNSATKSIQLNTFNQISKDFKEFFVDNNDILQTILLKSNNKTGEINNFCKSYLKYYSELDKSKPILTESFTYEMKTFSSLDNYEYEVLNYKNNLLDGTQKIFSTKGLNYELNISNQVKQFEKYYSDGKLALHCNSIPPYTYEFQNGVNLTLQSLKNQTIDIDKIFQRKDFQSALDGYNQLYKNSFPKDISENQVLNSKISKCENEMRKIADIKQQKEERQAEIIRQKEDKERIAQERKRKKEVQNVRNTEESSVDYSQIKGYYMLTDEDGNPQEINGLTLFYFLNSKGLIFMGFGHGSRYSEAFSNPADGIRSGAIKCGSYDINGNQIYISWKNGGSATWYIKHGAMGYKIVLSNGFKLNYIGDN